MATSVNAFVCCVFAFLVWFAFLASHRPNLGTTNSHPCRHLCFARIYTHFCYLCMHEYTIFLYIAIYVIVLYTIRWYIDTHSLIGQAHVTCGPPQLFLSAHHRRSFSSKPASRILPNKTPFFQEPRNSFVNSTYINGG